MVNTVELEHVDFGYKKDALIYRDLNLSFGVGLYGLLGSNGAGKTTLMNLIATLSQPSTGVVSIVGNTTGERRSRAEARAHVGYLPQHFEMMNGSTLLHNVRYAAWTRGLSVSQSDRAARRVIAEVGLNDEINKNVRQLSGGMRQRAGMACAMVNRPDVLILDEPTVGLDPIQRVAVRDLFDAYAQEHTVIISTHLVEDLAAIAGRVLVIDHGRVLMEGSVDDLAMYGSDDDATMTVWESGYRNLMESSQAHI